MHKDIVNFFKINKVATICCLNADLAPYCFNCFYVFQENTYLLLFKSSANSYHSKLLSKNPQVSGTILPDKLELLTIKGIQFSGRIRYDSFPDRIRAEINYHKALPLAFAKPGDVWCIALEMVKMTDNTKMFGKKLEWCKVNNVAIEEI